ncbi:MAG: hypothetical protein AAGD96_20650 [Chloroflexota bacterium]
MKQVKTYFLGTGLVGFIVVIVMLIAQPTFGKAAANSIIVTDADTVRTLNATESIMLEDLLDEVSKRVTIRFANSKRIVDLVQAPAALDSAIDAIEKRIVIRFGNTKRVLDLVAAPPALNTDLESVAERVILRFANTKRQTLLVFPIGMVPDNTPPAISQPSIVSGSDQTTISWTTDEFASSEFSFGSQDGNYPNVLPLTEISIMHEVKILQLQSGTYYYLIVSNDRSNNQAQITGSFEVKQATPTPVAATSTPTSQPATVTPLPTSTLDTPKGNLDIYLPFVRR